MEGDYEMETAIERWLAESAIANNLGFWRYTTGTGHNNMLVQAQGSDDNFEAIYKGMANVREAGGVVTGVAMAPQISAALASGKAGWDIRARRPGQYERHAHLGRTHH